MYGGDENRLCKFHVVDCFCIVKHLCFVVNILCVEFYLSDKALTDPFKDPRLNLPFVLSDGADQMPKASPFWSQEKFF
jgi:hypothetical protein